MLQVQVTVVQKKHAQKIKIQTMIILQQQKQYYWLHCCIRIFLLLVVVQVCFSFPLIQHSTTAKYRPNNSYLQRKLSLPYLQSSSSLSFTKSTSVEVNDNNKNTTAITATTTNTVNKSIATQSSLEITPSSSSPSSFSYQSLINMSIKTIGSSTTIFVSGVFFIILAIKRDAFTISFFIGAISNGILSKVLKKVIAQTRPIELHTSTDIVDKPSDHGMPSSHAMSLGFIATFIGCHIISVRIPLLLYTIVSLYYRIQVKLHTLAQVMVGTIVGSTNGYIWYQLCTGTISNINIMNIVTKYLLDPNTKQLPIPYLIVPLLVGATTIGSFERRIGKYFKGKRKDA